MPQPPFLEPLLATDLRAAGIPEPWGFGLADRVRFGEIDVLGHVNNTAYLRWFENLRIHYFRAYGVAEYDGEVPKIVLRNIALEFKAEVKLGDDYIVSARTSGFRTSSFEMEYGVWVRGKLTTTGHAVIVMLNAQNAKLPLTDAVRTAFISRDGAAKN